MAVEDQIQAFIDYLHNVKHTSENTELSYHRDLNKVKAYLEEQGFTDIKKVTSTTLNSYVLYMEKNKFFGSDHFQKYCIPKGILSLSLS